MYTQEEQKLLLHEVLDKNRVHLVCSQYPNGKPHELYMGSATPPPPRGCANCWKAYWWYMIASTPPHLREARLAAAEKAVRDAVQWAEAGNFDFVPFDRPEITIEKDAI
jgi:hypothetical protein